MDNFVASRDTPAMRALAELLSGGGERRLFLLAPQASGKSHLLQAACRDRAAAGHPVAYVPLREKARFAPDLLAGFSRLDLVCLDDVDAIAGEPEWERALFNLFNEIDANGGRLLIASRKRPAVFELRDLNSRLQSVLRVHLEAADDERRSRILSERASELGFVLPDEAVRYLLQHQARDLHSLMATLEGIDRYALACKRRVTLPLVLDFLRSGVG